MSILYFGDIHGRVNDLATIVNSAEDNGVEHLIQVGDCGLFWPTNNAVKEFHKSREIKAWNSSALDIWIQKRARQGKWKSKIITCGGNHDNWNVYYDLWEEQGRPDLIEVYPESGFYWASRGSLVNIQDTMHLFLGGAESTDQERRTPNLTWWDSEQANRSEFDRFFDNLDKGKPEVVVTHDAPLRVELYRARRNSSVTPNMLENALKLTKHKPSCWYYGHHHILQKEKIEGTKFFGCGLHGEFWEKSNDF